MNTDTKIAAAVVLLYLVISTILLPPAEYARAVRGGILVFGLIVAVARRMRRGDFAGMSVLVVAFASGIVLSIPTYPAMGGTSPVAVPLGFFGVQAAVLLWAALRWPPQSKSPSRASLVGVWMFGALAALVLSAIATIPVIIILLAGGTAGARILWVYPAYLVGTFGAATAYWLLQRIAHLATGRYLIGCLGGVCVYGAIGPVVSLFEEEPLSAGMMLVVALLAGGLVGPAVALDTRWGLSAG